MHTQILLLFCVVNHSDVSNSSKNLDCPSAKLSLALAHLDATVAIATTIKSVIVGPEMFVR